MHPLVLPVEFRGPFIHFFRILIVIIFRSFGERRKSEKREKPKCISGPAHAANSMAKGLINAKRALRNGVFTEANRHPKGFQKRSCSDICAEHGVMVNTIKASVCAGRLQVGSLE